MAWYRALWRRNVTVDVVPAGADLTGYKVVIVPTLYLLDDDAAARVADAARAGASVLVTYFSGIVDEHDHVRLGGYPGAFRHLLGVRTEEFYPLLDGEVRTLDDGTTSDLWTEKTHLTGADAMRTYADGPLAGLPAITRRAVGDGVAWYVATRLDEAGLGRLVDDLLAESGAGPVAPAPAGVELVRRHGDEGRSFLFVINHTGDDVTVPATGREMLAGTDARGEVHVPALGVAVVQEG